MRGVAALVDGQKFIVDALFAPKIFGNPDAGDRLLDAGVDIGNCLLAAAGGPACPPLKGRGNSDHSWRQGQQQQGERPVDRAQIDDQNENQQQLRTHFCDQHSDPAELVGVGRDPADDPPRLVAVKKTHVMVHHRTKSVDPQCKHNIAEQTGSENTTHPVDCPVGHTHPQHQSHQHHQHRRAAAHGTACPVDPLRHQDWQQGPRQRQQAGQKDHCNKTLPEQPEVSGQSSEKCPIGVGSVVTFRPQPIAYHTHPSASSLAPVRRHHAVQAQNTAAGQEQGH